MVEQRISQLRSEFVNKQRVISVLLALFAIGMFPAIGHSIERGTSSSRRALVAQFNQDFLGKVTFGTCGVRSQILGALINPGIAPDAADAIKSQLFDKLFASKAASSGFTELALDYPLKIKVPIVIAVLRQKVQFAHLKIRDIAVIA